MAKKIILIPAFKVPNVYNDSHVYSAVDFPNVDLERYSKVPGVTLLEVMLNPGEAIFMPIDWWYQVEYLSI